jgi:hypothetical protein
VFTVDVFADGSVRYVGDRPAKELGERRSKIAVSDVRRLALSARAVAKGSVGAPVKLASDEEPYCLEVTLREAATMSQAKVANDAQAARRLIRTLDEVVRPKQWVCPMRGSRTVSDVRFNDPPFCGGYRARADISYWNSDDRNCVRYAGRVYRHEMYSWSYYVTGEGKTVLLDDRFQPLTEQQFRALIDAAKRAHLLPSDIEERGEHLHRDYYGGSEQGLTAFWKTLQEVAPIGPAASVPTPTGCNTDYLSPGRLSLFARNGAGLRINHAISRKSGPARKIKRNCKHGECIPERSDDLHQDSVGAAFTDVYVHRARLLRVLREQRRRAGLGRGDDGANSC